MAWRAYDVDKRRCSSSPPLRLLGYRVVSIIVLLSTLCYVLDIRAQYGDQTRAVYSELEEQLRHWSRSSVAGADNGGRAIFDHHGTWSSPVASLAEKEAVRGSEGRELFRLLEVNCAWERRSPREALPLSNGTTLAPQELLVFFIHGNSGGVGQGIYWACAMTLRAKLRTGVGAGSELAVRTYTFSVAEQANVHRGRLLGLQADFVADAVEAEVGRRASVSPPGEGRGATPRVWLVGHSMGGIVARIAAAIVRPRAAYVEGILTFNTPHRYPPVILDRPLRDVYVALNRIQYLAGARVDTNGSSSWAQPPHSAALVAACGAWSGPSLECGARFRPPPVLVSLTSGEMDLQIQPATAFPLCGTPVHLLGSGAATDGAGSPAEPNRCMFVNMLSESACSCAASHDGVLNHPCMVAYAVATVFNLSLHQRTHPTAEPLGAERAARAAHVSSVGVRENVQVPLPSALAAWLAGMLGRALWQHHLWPFAVGAFVITCLLWSLDNPQRLSPAGSGRGGHGESELLPLGAPAMISLRRTRGRALRQLLRCPPVPVDTPTRALLLVLLVNALMLTVAAVSCVAGPSVASTTVRPWLWDRWGGPLGGLASPSGTAVADCVIRLVHGYSTLLLSAAAACVGLCSAMGLLAALRAAQYAAAAVSGVFLQGIPMCSFRTRRRLMWAPSAAVAALFFAALLVPLSVTVRAFLLLASSVVAAAVRVAEVRVYREKDDDARVDADKVQDSGGSLGPAVLFSSLHLIQLQPVFTIRNEWVSRTKDDIATVDPLLFVTEACVLVLIVAPPLLSRMTAPLLVRQRYAVPLRVVGRAIGIAACCAGCSLLAVSPIEMSNMGAALLAAFPLFVSRAMSFPG